MSTPSWDDTDYDETASEYQEIRRPDPRIALQLHAQLGAARNVLHVGAGQGSYEPTDRHVVAVEPSAAMRARRQRHLPPAIDAAAENLPFDDDAFDAALAVHTVHHWPDVAAGLTEVRRVTRGPIVIVTCDPEALDRFWLMDYAPSYHHAEQRRYPAITDIVESLGGTCEVDVVPIPLDCTDGFTEAFYGRPEELLRPEVRAAQSGWSFSTASDVSQFVRRLSNDLESGAWDTEHGHLRTQPVFEGATRLVVARP